MCTVSPPYGTACQPSDDDFKTTYGGDKDCGNLGYYGTCQSNGLCECPPDSTGNNCQFACNTSDSIDKQCGGALCGTCNVHLYGQCTCLNGWSGRQCQTPPDTPCETDEDCGWETTNGVCETWGDTKKCTCQAGYYGNRCERVRGGEGSTCMEDEDCEQPYCQSDDFCSTMSLKCCGDSSICGKNKCTDNVCVVTGTKAPSTACDDDDDSVTSQIAEVLASLFTVKGITTILGQGASKYIINETLEKLVTYPYQQYLESTIAKRMTEKETVEASSEIVAEMIIEVETEVAVKLAAEALARTAIKDVLKSVAGVVRGVLGSIMEVVDAFQMVGMILDLGDTAGLSGQLTQDYLDLYAKKMLQIYNTNEDMIAAGVHYPFEVSAASDLDYVTTYLGNDNMDNMVEYMGNYISALKVNSEGNTISFKPSSTIQSNADAAHNSSALNAALWSVSAGNEDVFQRWVKYWWVALIVLLFCFILLLVPLLLYSSRIKQINQASK